ncbi:MAG: ABC-three component system protein [Pyrinomonadaceae bacterium]
MTLADHSAPGTNAGFSYQFERALYWLAQSPAGSVIGVETDDDVAVRGADGSQLLEQDKHSILEDAKPFGDRSKDLWNTLTIWIEAVDSKEVVPEATLFLMVTNKVLPECIAHQIGRAKSESEITACIESLEAASKKPPKHIAPLLLRVLSSDSRTNLRKLISRCEMADASQATAGPHLRKETIAHLQLPAWYSAEADSIVDELLGWLHTTALASWQKNLPAWIQRDHFVNQLHAIINRRKREIARERAEHLIPVTDDKIGQNRGSPFVKQLHLVTDDDSIVDNAIREFIRCNIEKSRLSEEGNVTDDDWRAFETTLLSRWDKIRARVIRMKPGVKEEDVGFEIFTDTTEEHREKLAGSDTEQVYLTSGTYHRLADMVRVGWHPRFEELMRELMTTL